MLKEMAVQAGVLVLGNRVMLVKELQVKERMAALLLLIPMAVLTLVLVVEAELLL
jgi:hypothetical protein